MESWYENAAKHGISLGGAADKDDKRKSIGQVSHFALKHVPAEHDAFGKDISYDIKMERDTLKPTESQTFLSALNELSKTSGP